MKKYLSLVLVVLMCLTFAACGSSADADAVADYVEKNRSDLVAAMEQSFATSSGMSCTSSIEAEGTGFVMSININGWNNIPEATAQQLQQAYAALDSTFEGMLKDMQSEIPELTYFVINVCEEDGDVLASVEAGNK